MIKKEVIFVFFKEQGELLKGTSDFFLHFFPLNITHNLLFVPPYRRRCQGLTPEKKNIQVDRHFQMLKQNKSFVRSQSTINCKMKIFLFIIQLLHNKDILMLK